MYAGLDSGADGYHGYWGLDFTRPNPHFGSLADLRLGQTAGKALLAAGAMAALAALALSAHRPERVILPTADGTPDEATLRWEEILAHGTETEALIPQDPDDPFLLLYSSGTTGQSARWTEAAGSGLPVR